MSNQPELIKPKAVPLSHATAARRGRGRDLRKLVVYLLFPLAGAMLFALFAFAPQFLAPEPVPGTRKEDRAIVGDITGEGTRSPPDTRASKPPPFEALRRQQARTEAQDELARFVELEIELRDSLEVAGWADEALDAAKELAHRGDESFVEERHAEAIEHYRAAADSLATLLIEGHSRFEAALANTLRALRDRDPREAENWLKQARMIKPEDAELLALTVRAGHLSEIIELFREAHNQELAGQWDDAIATYGRIRALDPATQGLDPALAKARREQSAQRLQSFLSAGFAQLSKDRLQAAQASFNKALSLDPENGAALGGLQQVEEQRLVKKVARLQREATQATAGEDWPAAIQAFEAILAMDANIQFARTGLAEATLQAETLAALRAIVAQAAGLSSDRRFAEARATLARAKEISPRGPLLAKSIAKARALLDRQATPVPVVLQSDNATEILLSNIGPLGKFSELRLDLRPGAYTLIGSRDGCRDVRTTITVRTGMPPVDIRCQEVLAR